MLLLPGLAALLGFYSPSKLSRDVVAQGALVQLGVLIFVSFVIHVPLLLLLQVLAQWVSWLDVDFEYVFAILDTGIGGTVKDVDHAVDRSMLRAFCYFLASAGLGWILGRAIGKMVIAGKLPSVALHGWAFQLVGASDKDTGVTFAYVMTHVRHEERVLVYRGALDEFHIAPDGRISYLILRDSLRFYLKLESSAPLTTSAEHWKVIGATDGGPGLTDFRFMMIEGEDIANVVFHRFGFLPEDTDLDKLYEELTQNEDENTLT